ncbi:hypothetical protein LLG96_20480 [bacterium]|nr:hypothetical protein [bacterium]
MFKKLTLTAVIFLIILPILSVYPDSNTEKSVKNAFGTYQEALNKEDYKTAWNSYSKNMQAKSSYEAFVKNYSDQETRDVYGSLQVVAIDSTDNGFVLAAKLGGMWSRLAKKKLYYRFIAEGGTWKINDFYPQSPFSRTPQKGYLPGDIASLDAETKAEVAAIQQVCLTYTKSMSAMDFRKAWECYWDGRIPYDRFVNLKYVRRIRENESIRQYLASLTVLNIKYSENQATADIGKENEKDFSTIYLLVKNGGQWKLRKEYDITSLGFGEDDLPAFYFEQGTSQSGIVKKKDTLASRGQIPPDGKALEPYVAFLKQGHSDPVDYVMHLFDTNDIVVLCERMHPESTQWDMIFSIVSDKRFIDRVGNIFTEYGSVNLQPYLDDFMNTDGLSEKEIGQRSVHIMRNLGLWPLWPNTNFYRYLNRLYALNQSLPRSARIHHYLSDIPLDWDTMTQAGYDSLRVNVFPVRDKVMADRIIAKVRELNAGNAKRKKCLVIMNYRHAFGPIRDAQGKIRGNTCEYLFEAFPGKTANVLINTVGIDESEQFVKIADGKWDNAFKAVDDPAAGFDFRASPFGKDPFDMYPAGSWIKEKYTYQDVFTGFIFYLPLSRHLLEDGFPGILDGFENTLLSRAKCLKPDASDSYKNEVIPLYKKGVINSRKPSYANF